MLRLRSLADCNVSVAQAELKYSAALKAGDPSTTPEIIELCDAAIKADPKGSNVYLKKAAFLLQVCYRNIPRTGYRSAGTVLMSSDERACQTQAVVVRMVWVKRRSTICNVAGETFHGSMTHSFNAVDVNA